MIIKYTFLFKKEINKKHLYIQYIKEDFTIWLFTMDFNLKKIEIKKHLMDQIKEKELSINKEIKEKYWKEFIFFRKVKLYWFLIDLFFVIFNFILCSSIILYYISWIEFEENIIEWEYIIKNYDILKMKENDLKF